MRPTDSTSERGTIPHLPAERFHAGREEEEEGKRNGGQVIHELHLPRATTPPVDNPATTPGQVMDDTHDDRPLFGGYEPPEREELSADQRRTRRQATQVAAGVHPLTGGRLHPDADNTRTASSPQDGSPTCGTCQYRGLVGHHDQAFPKCHRPGGTITHGPGTDVRAWWPACTTWTPKAGA